MAVPVIPLLSSSMDKLLGIDEVARRISEMINSAKHELGLSDSRHLDVVGICLSGCPDQLTAEQLKQAIKNVNPEAAVDYVIKSDLISSLKTGLSSCGIIIIAGTGSNAYLVDVDGTEHQCGGWGHMIGDEGGAYWISHRACKYVIDDIDGLKKAPYSIDYIWSEMQNYYKITDIHSMKMQLYKKFSKNEFALFAKHIAAGCKSGDSLCLSVLEKAGKYLAKHINALATKASVDLLTASGGLKVVCVGTVWNSWEYLKKGFTEEIRRGGIINELTLYRLITSAAVGACYLAADMLTHDMGKMSREKNRELLYHYIRESDGTLKVLQDADKST
ncbi:N-acetyl-D-glucosamine kinase isoform X2 [Orussus abietinus]|uniref:N-acetyl-D-glucosamine kinase isoform X2 n=1 Tax=Orussus abietinus TaxID=222816 RepID=UPI0006265B0B|nr:N-acetyl-D-glucosamine kinase isoform X2 [Orussus abietinus]